MEAICYRSKVFLNTLSFEKWGISLEYSPLSDAFRPIAREQKYLMDYNIDYHSL